MAAYDVVIRNGQVADGTGKKRWTWITPKAGWLVMDPKSAGRIESEAVLLDVFDDIWPDAYRLDHLRVDPDELAAAIAHHRDGVRKYRTKRTTPARGSGRD